MNLIAKLHPFEGKSPKETPTESKSAMAISITNVGKDSSTALRYLLEDVMIGTWLLKICNRSPAVAKAAKMQKNVSVRLAYGNQDTTLVHICRAGAKASEVRKDIKEQKKIDTLSVALCILDGDDMVQLAPGSPLAAFAESDSQRIHTFVTVIDAHYITGEADKLVIKVWEEEDIPGKIQKCDVVSDSQKVSPPKLPRQIAASAPAATNQKMSRIVNSPIQGEKKVVNKEAKRSTAKKAAAMKRKTSEKAQKAKGSDAALPSVKVGKKKAVAAEGKRQEEKDRIEILKKEWAKLSQKEKKACMATIYPGEPDSALRLPINLVEDILTRSLAKAGRLPKGFDSPKKKHGKADASKASAKKAKVEAKEKGEANKEEKVAHESTQPKKRTEQTMQSKEKSVKDEALVLPPEDFHGYPKRVTRTQGFDKLSEEQKWQSYLEYKRKNREAVAKSKKKQQAAAAAAAATDAGLGSSLRKTAEKISKKRESSNNSTANENDDPISPKPPAKKSAKKRKTSKTTPKKSS